MLYVCAVVKVKKNSSLEIAYDIAIIDKEELVKKELEITTTTHHSLKDGLLYACLNGFHSYEEITAVLCLLVDENEKGKEEIINAV